MNLVTQEEAAVMLRRTVGTIYRWRRSGVLPSIPGRPVMIDIADIQKLKDINQWPDTTKVQESSLTLADIMKSAGPKKDGLNAFQRGQAKWLKQRRS